jgi:hypothetical protein
MCVHSEFVGVHSGGRVVVSLECEVEVNQWDQRCKVIESGVESGLSSKMNHGSVGVWTK